MTRTGCESLSDHSGDDDDEAVFSRRGSWPSVGRVENNNNIYVLRERAPAVIAPFRRRPEKVLRGGGRETNTSSI